MAGNLLSNPTFATHSPAAGLPHHPAGFCENWHVKSKRNGAFELKPVPYRGEQGFRLETGTALPSSFRIWQRIDASRFSNAQSARLDISARGDGAPGGITLEWVALLKVEENGARVFARKLLNRPHNFDGVESEFAVDVLVPKLEPGVDYDFALQFAGGPGFIEVHSVELIAGVFAPAITIDILDPSPPAAADVARAGLANGQLIAFADQPGRVPATAPASIPLPRRSARKAGAKRHVAVVSWDMGHNPAGRAFLLADMAARNCTTELVGPLFPKYGDEIWKPISASSLPMHAYPAPTFRAFVEGAIAIAQRTTCDIVHVGKARFPSLLLGALIKQANNCPMIVDVDDHELGFFTDRRPATLQELMAEIHVDPTILDRPYAEIFTRYAETLIAECDGVTVSNYALKDRFGGIVVRHGRDERIFDPQRYDRSAIRREFGYGDQDRVILFLGTPRAHKGVFEIADAMEALDDQRLALCIIGSINDKRVSGRLNKYKRARIASHPDQPWERLAELVAMADAVFLLQDPASAISDYQIPAKLTDALAMGVPVFATPVPPLRDLIAVGAVTPVAGTAQLRAALQSVSEKPSTAGADQRPRDYYLTELSYGVNAARLDIAFDAATTRSRKAVPAFDDLFAAMERQTGIAFPRFTRKFGAPAIWKNIRPDLVFLWKQNDSGIYGRRSDMMVRHLLESGAVNRVLHFDAPISATDLEKQVKHGDEAVADQGNLVHLNTTRRVMRVADTGLHARRTFLYRPNRTPQHHLGIDLPPKDGYEDFIRQNLKDAAIDAAPILWVCPVVFDYPMIHAVVRPSCVVADIIDDQRAFPSSDAFRRRLHAAYEDVLEDADVVLANCEPVREGFGRLRSDIRVIPNGAEEFDLSESWPVPEELAHLPRPILGYVGNLRDRVDLDLIGKVADRFSHGSIVLIGSAHGRREVLELNRRPNVHFLGVKPYNDAVRYIRAFDVALLPHLRNGQSESMNPLKLYVYFALGVPIVATDVANIGDVGPFVAIARSHGAFIDLIERTLDGRIAPPTIERDRILSAVSWKTRVADALSAIGLDRPN